MKIERIKTIILTILVATSLLLTFGLWNYQPNYEPLYSSTDSTYLTEVDLGGQVETKKTLINPATIVFKINEKYFGFNSAADKRMLYNKIQEWELTNLMESEAKGRPSYENQVELLFPDELPMDLIKTIFNYTEGKTLPTWSFQQVFVSFDQTNSALQVTFLSADRKQQASFTVNNADDYLELLSYLSLPESLTEFILFGSEDRPIYLPKDPVKMKSRSVSVEIIDSSLLVNALFTNPSLVSPNIGEAYFTDGQRGMRVIEEGRKMEFINPIHDSEDHMGFYELLDRSLKNINGHKGWVDDYSLLDIDVPKNIIRFQMYHDGYPVFNESELTIIEQQWRNKELHQYSRPLFNMDNVLGSEEVTLPSGEDIIEHLTVNKKYNLESLYDIQLGYHLSYLEGASFSISLDPAWYMNYNGVWHKIKLEENKAEQKGGQ